MQSVEISYIYRKSEESDLEQFLTSLQIKIGGERKPYFAKHGALDLVSFLEMSIVVAAGIAIKPVIQKYFEGLFDADSLKKVGEEHRRQLAEWFDDVENSLSKMIDAVHAHLLLMHTTFAFNGKEKAITLEIPTDAGNLYVVLNHKNKSSTLLKNLPKGIVSAIRFIYERGVQGRTVALQLYYDEESQEWVYLFAPSIDGFGNYIDRYVDLRNNQVRFISSPLEFNNLFRPSIEDEFKFLVSPFRHGGI